MLLASSETKKPSEKAIEKLKKKCNVSKVDFPCHSTEALDNL